MLKKPANAEIKDIFDAAAQIYDKVTNSYAVARRRDILALWATGDCLEVGAGTGEITRALVKNNHRVVATDISPKMAEEIRQKLGIETLACDSEKLPFPNSSFDTIISAEMIYYLDNPERFIAEAKRVLKPEGRLLISSAARITRIYHFIRALMRKFGVREMYFDDPVYNFPSISRLRVLIEDGGFEIKETRRIIIAPFKFLDWLDSFLEKTPFCRFAAFILIRAEKP